MASTPAVPPPSHGASASSILEAVRKLALVQQQFTDAKAQLTALQQKEMQLEYNFNQLQSDNKRLTTAANEARDELDSTKRLNEDHRGRAEIENRAPPTPRTRWSAALRTRREK